ncbi:MAG: transposase [Flavobacteriales bacterium Tduv]
MLRSTEQISFSELYMKRSTRRSQFFKRLNTLIPLGRDRKEIRKIYQKGQGIKNQPAYTGISLFTMMLLSQKYDLSDIETEELMKDSLSFMRFCSFRLEDQIPDLYDLYADFEMK